MPGSEFFELCPDHIYRCKPFGHFVWQKHGFGTRTANPPAGVTLRQVHSNRVVNARGLRDREFEGDALITNDTGVSIGIRTADCVPILLLDSRNHALAAVHAGWRGTAAQIIVRATEQMRADFGTDPADLHAAIGPCIRACCYEVGEAVASQFDSAFVTHGSGGKLNVDLALANRHQIESAAVDPACIYDSGLCTACLRDRFFSYRREPQNPGRMLSSICRVA